VLILEANAAYERNRRYLRCRLIPGNMDVWQSVHFSIRWNPLPYQSRQVFAYRLGLEGFVSARIREGRAEVLGETPDCRVNRETLPFPHDLTDLYTIARMIAAGKTPKFALTGWIEDNLSEPWSLLASPQPLDCLRALCPTLKWRESDAHQSR
jgi:hypothetical protein